METETPFSSDDPDSWDAQKAVPVKEVDVGDVINYLAKQMVLPANKKGFKNFITPEGVSRSRIAPVKDLKIGSNLFPRLKTIVASTLKLTLSGSSVRLNP